MLPNPSVHHNPRRHPGIDRPSTPELRNRHHHRRSSLSLLRQPRPLLPEQQHTLPRQRSHLHRHRPRRVIHSHHRQPGRSSKRHQAGNILVMPQMLVPIRHHRPTTVPPPPPHNVHLGSSKGIGRPNNRPDIVVMLKVLNGHVERMPSGIHIGHDGRAAPIPVPIHHVPTIPVLQQLRVVPRVRGPRAHPGPHTNRLTTNPLGGPSLGIVRHEGQFSLSPGGRGEPECRRGGAASGGRHQRRRR